MCPCPFCTTLAILLCPLLLFKDTRKWLNNLIKKHHRSCEVCQQAEHEQHLHDHTPCHCNACTAKQKTVKAKTPDKNKAPVKTKPSVKPKVSAKPKTAVKTKAESVKTIKVAKKGAKPQTAKVSKTKRVVRKK